MKMYVPCNSLETRYVSEFRRELGQDGEDMKAMKAKLSRIDFFPADKGCHYGGVGV